MPGTGQFDFSLIGNWTRTPRVHPSHSRLPDLSEHFQLANGVAARTLRVHRGGVHYLAVARRGATSKLVRRENLITWSHMSEWFLVPSS